METETKQIKCEKCGSPKITLSPIVLTSCPAQYSATCDQCAHEFGFFGHVVFIDDEKVFVSV